MFSTAGYRKNLKRTLLPALLFPTCSPIVILHGYLHVSTWGYMYQSKSRWSDILMQHVHLYQRNLLNHFSLQKLTQRKYLALVSLLLLLHHKFSSFLGRNLHFVPYSLVAVHTWLLVLEPDLAYVMCQQSAGRCPYLGNTPVSLYSYVDGDIGCKYTLGISQGCSLGSDLQFHAHASLSQEFCRPPSTYVHASRAGLLPSTRRKERLALRKR